MKKCVFLLFVLPLMTFGQSPQTFNASGTWTCPAGVTSIYVEAWGAGAGGYRNTGFAAGGGGAYAGGSVTVTPGTTYTVTVGVGGVGGPPATTGANNGGNSSFAALIIADGGGDGTTNRTRGLASNCTGTVKFDGGTGGDGTGTGSNGAGGGGGGSGGAGGAGGTGGNTTNATPGVAGTAGAAGTRTGGAAGGVGGNPTNSGAVGSIPGGGGGERGDNAVALSQPGGNGRVIVSWSCPTFALTNTSTIDACKTANTTVVTLSGNAANLPVGTYTVTYKLSYDSYTASYTAPMTVSTAGTGLFIANVAAVVSNSTTFIRVDNLTSSGCSTNITSGNISNSVYMYPALSAPSGLNGFSSGSCSSYTLQWQNGTPNVTNYYLDVSTSSTFAAGFYLAGYQNKDMGTSFSDNITALTSGTQYYWRVRAANICGTTASTIGTSFTVGAAVAAIAGGATTVCEGATTAAFTNATAGGTWSITPGTGTATITSPGGVVTGGTAGTVTVVYSVTNSGCTSTATKALTVNASPVAATLSSNSPICSGNNAVFTITGTAGNTVTYTGATSGTATIGAGGTTTVTVSGVTANTTLNLTNVSNGSCNRTLSATTTVTVNSLPTITTAATPAVVTVICQSASAQTTTLAYTATTNNPTSYSIDWATLTDQGLTAFAFTAGAGTITGITVPAGTAAGTYTGTMTITNANGCTGTKTITLTVNGSTTPTPYGTTQAICYNSTIVGVTNIGAVSYTTVPIDRYVVLSVIQGIQYQISTTNTNLSFNKQLDLYNNSNPIAVLATNTAANNTTAATITWTASFSGDLRIVYKASTCQSSAATETITATYTGGSNTADSTTAFGTDSWIGHVYNFSDAAAVPPSDLDAYSSYIGSFTQANTVATSGAITTTSFSQSYGGDTNCFNVTAGGTAQTVYTETFAVKYRMRSTLPAGCYILQVTGDDGVRATIDGNSVFSEWKQQGSTTYDNILVYLNGNSDILFEYYEKNGGNITNFSIRNVDPTINSMITSGPITRCANLPAGGTVLNASAITYQGSTSNPSIVFQWQSSTDNSNWTDISGANSEDYTVPTTNPASTTTLYYRRKVTGVAANTGSCITATTSVAVITSPAAPATPGTITPSTSAICLGSSPTNYSITSVPNATSYTWTVTGTGNTISGAGTTGTVTWAAGYSGTATISVTATNGCGTSSAASTTVTVSPTSAVGAISGNQTICSGSSPSSNITIASATGTVQWQIADDSAFTTNLSNIGTNSTTLTIAQVGILTATRYFRAVVTSGSCSAVTSGTVTVTVNTTVTSGAIGTAQTICSGATPATLTSSTAGTGTGTITYEWQTNASGSYVTIGSATAATYSPPALTTTTSYQRRTVAVSGGTTCYSGYTTAVTITVNAAVTAGTIGTAQTICNGGTPATLTSIADGTGSGIIAYEWQTNASGSYVTIGGATSATYAPPALTATTSFQRRTVSVSGGTTCYSGYTTAVTITVNATVTAGAIGTAQTICNGVAPATLTSSTAGTGTGTITYEWQTNASGSYVTIGSATGATYSPPALTATTSYQRRTVAVSGGTTCYSGYTTAVTITVNAAVTAGTIGTAQTICNGGTPATLTSIADGTGSGTITYEWQTNTSGSYVTIPSATSATYAPPALTATTSYQRRTVAVSGGTTCYSAYTTPVTITVSPAITTNTIATAQTICSGVTPVALTGSTPTGGSGSYVYLWESSTTSASAGFGNAAGTNSNIGYNPASLSATTWFRRTVTSGGCSNTSTAIEITVTPFTAAPTVGTITQPDCATATGSVILNSLPSGSWILTRSPGNVVTTGTGTSTTITGLVTGTYTYSVIGTNNGTGLKAEYFNNMTLTGTPVLTRTDAAINNDWANASPDPAINADNFSVRWSGQVQPLYSETYTFTTSSDDGIRLWVNGTQVINNWTDHSVATNTGTITLVAGVKYAIVQEFYENGGQAVAKLSWNSASQALQIIPQSQMYPAPTCSSAASANVVINAQPSTPSVPLVAAPTQPSCSTPTGSVLVSGLPATGSWTLTRSGTSSATTVSSGTSITVSNLAAGSYTFTVTQGACTSSASTSVGITGLTTTTWNGSAWNSGTPTLNTLAILNGNYDTATYPDINACTLTINGGFTLTIQNQKFVTIQNDLTVNTGSIVEIKNQGSLVMINDTGVLTTVGTGKFNVNKTTSAFEKYDYTYWATPLAGTTTIATVFPTWRLDKAYEFHPENFIDLINVFTGQAIPDGFDDNEDDWLTTSSMSSGRGYIIMGPTTGSFPRTESVVFSGKVNTGVLTTPIQLTPDTTDPEDDFNLVGNPYPCAISADALIKANISGTGTINKTIDGTLWFWTHKADIANASNGLQSYNYSQDDYAVYTLAGGTGTSASASGGAKPLGYIASGQGFFVEATANGLLTFNNSMRVSPAITASPVTPTTANTQFYKTMPIKTKVADKNRIWLNLENDLGMFSQQLIAYFENTTLGRDNGYDGLLSDAGNYINFYSIENNDAFKIQARPTFSQDDEVPLGYFSAVAGTFNINIDSKEGVFNDGATNVYLEDKLLDVIHDLKAAPYTFATEEGTFDDRFVLRYTNKSLGTGDFDALKNSVLVAVKSKKITINSFAETLDKVVIYDVLGKQLYKKSMLNANEFSILNLPSSEQTLLVKVTLQNGQTVTKKIIY